MNGKQAQAIEKEADNIPLQIGFKRLSDTAVLPTKAHPSDSGWDLYASADVIIAPGETVVIPTDIAVVLPEGYEAQVRPRSGVTSKTKLRVQLGTIDNGYNGNIGIIVDNIGENVGEQCYERRVDGTTVHRPSKLFKTWTYRVLKGDKIAQLVVQQLPQTVAVEITEELAETDRGTNGWGSSGV